MNTKGNTLIESLLFFTIVIMIVQSSCTLVINLQKIEIANYDNKYEEAYK